MFNTREFGSPSQTEEDLFLLLSFQPYYTITGPVLAGGDLPIVRLLLPEEAAGSPIFSPFLFIKLSSLHFSWANQYVGPNHQSIRLEIFIRVIEGFL